MKTLLLLKGLVIVLTLAIVGAFAFVIVKVTENPSKIKQKRPTPIAAPIKTADTLNGLQFGETAEQITPCLPYVCVLTKGANGQRVLMLDMTKGAIIQSVDLNAPVK